MNNLDKLDPRAAPDLTTAALTAIAASRATDDPDYPLFHLAPPVGKLNDPNGLCVVDGVHHAFYQFSPFFPRYEFHPDEPRKLVYWGHASSGDLARWTPHPPALVPDTWYETHGAYSGNGLLHEGVAYLHYTGNVRHPDGSRDTHQCLATTTDFVTFTKHPGNPLIAQQPAGYTAHTRDPQVWRDADGSFRLCLGSQREADLTGCALLYRSNDLTHWRFEGELTFPGHEERFAHCGYMWECPAIVQVPDEAGGTHDVLIFCPQGMEPTSEGFANIFPACYVVGTLEGAAFHATSGIHEIDRGFEFYAPQTFARASGDDGPVLLAAWLGNASEDDLPSAAYGWWHTFTLVRELRVRDGRLVQIPRVELGGAPVPVTPPAPGTDVVVEPLAGSGSFNLRFSIVDGHAPDAAVQVRIGTPDSHVLIDVAGGVLTVDRSRTRYAHGERRSVTLPAISPLVVEVFQDRSTTEIFVGDGLVTFSQRSFLARGEGSDAGVRVGARGGAAIVAMSAHRVD